MVRRDTRLVGTAAEQLAFRYLRDQGLVPVQRNFRCRLGELDLIMRQHRCLVVVEVRARSATSFVPARLSIDRRKQQKIIRTTALFLAWNERYSRFPVRFDVVGVDADGRGETTIDWVQDAFRPVDSSL